MKISVLIVDDDLMNLFLLEIILNNFSNSFIIHKASNAEMAIKMCDKTKFDLIFMDYHMPVMNGVEAMNEIRKSGINTETPICFITADSRKTIEEECYNAGCISFITKPINIELLKDVCNEQFPGIILNEKL